MSAVVSGTVEKGEHAQISAFVGAIAVADLVKTTLGPKGMDKILQSTTNPNDVTVTNDGATILKSVPVDNPAAKVLVDISMTQDKEVGDGTTSVVVLAGELLREAERLAAQKMHPQIVIRGWRKAVEVAVKALEEVAEDNGQDKEKFRQDLLNIARTTLSSKIVRGALDKFAELAVDAVLKIGKNSMQQIQVIKKVGGQLSDSFLAEGFILDKSFGQGQPKRIENARVLVANTPMDTDKIKIFGARVRVNSMSEVAAIEKAEKLKMKEKCDKILKHHVDGKTLNLFVNRQLIYNYPEQIFADGGISSIEHADFEGVERLALVLGADIVSTFDDPDNVKLGKCDLVEEIMIGEDKLIKFSGVPKENGNACSIVLRGASSHILAEAERSIHDALCVLTQTVQRNSKVVCGGGASEMVMAKKVSELAASVPGKESFAIEAFARALRTIPIILADNAGYDSAELVSQLRALHTKGKSTMGLNMNDGVVGDMKELRVCESFKSKYQSLVSAHEAAEMILRVDDIVKCRPRQRTDPHMH